ncbi:peptidase [Catenovulum sp. SM1970]|uniref:M14 family zinc carboxypeptidase n=1 Tax=Marinifaba aquimaris TaxID=2741323 RepID=UPI001573013D|nr:M14 family metallopeptidase [Marinifaba aquimaris]NTS77027.1 peptidase [Marinifaba aquimaris]
MKKQYTSYEETIAFLKQAMGEDPNLIRVQSIGDTWEGRPIMLATISLDVAYADHKPALLYTGSIHAREWIGNELAIKFIDYIIKNYRFNPLLLSALSKNTLYIVPCLNPDGFEYSRTHFSFWRKNRRNNGDGSFGVDLNRNFGVRFRRGKDKSANTYGGPEAFSEPETKAIKHFVESHNNITVALDYHSQGNVFFPAHKFNHEAEIDGTDLNVLCANMNAEIKKVTGRVYGIHRGKPPVNLIHGSGREYYYSRGILSTVVEVGTRNIPDYMQNMSQSIDENIPALIYALSESINYSNAAPKRPEQFSFSDISNNEVTLTWHYEDTSDVYFEIYRSFEHKQACCEQNRVAITRSLCFTDVQLKSGQKYFYNIRAVDRITKIKSPFGQELKLKTLLANDEFSLTLFPAKKDVGYVAEFSGEKNPEHFGYNSMFIGVNKRRGICYGVIAYPLENLPSNAQIKSACFSLYPMNRVAAKIENYGEWSISILDPEEISDYTNFQQVKNAKTIHTLGHTIASDKLTQGIWTEWRLRGVERNVLEKCIANKKIIFRIEGPDELPLGNDSQVMQFDIGYGPFGSGIHYRPNLEVIYTLPPERVELSPVTLNTIFKDSIEIDRLAAGFDSDGNVVYGQMAFTSEQLPEPDKTVITQAYLLMRNKNALSTNQDIRFTIELAHLKDLDYLSVKQREKIEFIGYEVSNDVLKNRSTHHFIFDSYCRQELERLHETNEPYYFILRATSVFKEQNALVNWHNLGDEYEARLVIEYIKRRKHSLPAPSDVKTTIENNKVKLTWKNPDHEDFVGAYVVRNRFHPPRSPLDGVKLYGGKDEYTLDNFGNANIPKFYSVFSYDEVPNFSQPSCVLYTVNETLNVEEVEALDEEAYEQNDD